VKMRNTICSILFTNIEKATISLWLGGSIRKASLYIMDGGHNVVFYYSFRGMLDESVGKGTHFLITFLQKPFIFKVETKAKFINIVISSKDC